MPGGRYGPAATGSARVTVASGKCSDFSWSHGVCALTGAATAANSKANLNLISFSFSRVVGNLRQMVGPTALKRHLDSVLTRAVRGTVRPFQLVGFHKAGVGTLGSTCLLAFLACTLQSARVQGHCFPNCSASLIAAFHSSCISEDSSSQLSVVTSNPVFLNA